MTSARFAAARLGWVLLGAGFMFIALRGWEPKTARSVDDEAGRHPADMAADQLSPWKTDLHDRGAERGLDVIDWNETPVIGSRRHENGATEYNITAVFGLEQWEGSRLASHARERWGLTCRDSRPDRRGKIPSAVTRPDCSLTQDRLLASPNDRIAYPVIRYHTYDSSAGDLAFRTVEWDTGVLNFSLLILSTPGIPPIEVSIRFDWRNDTMFLKEFTAGTLSTPRYSDSGIEPIQFKIPEYSYAYYVPFGVTGWKRSVYKRWNDLIQTLSEGDQRVWRDLSGQQDEFGTFATREFAATNARDSEEKLLRSFIEKIFPGRQVSEKNPFTAEEQRRLTDEMNRWFVDRFAEWLRQSEMSPHGQSRLVTYVHDSR